MPDRDFYHSAQWQVMEEPDDAGQKTTQYVWQHPHQGGRLDAINRLYHFRNRDYDPMLMRWTRQAPLTYRDSQNLYDALPQTPINKRDSTEITVIAFDIDGGWTLDH